MDYGYLDRNVSLVREKINAACEASPYDKQVTMLAAVKYADIGEINYLCDSLGVRDIGENRVQQLLEHYEGLNDKSVNIHFIGTLQTNKVKYLVGKVDLIHSVDSMHLAQAICDCATKRNLIQDVLVQVNIGKEEQKGGIDPDTAIQTVKDISCLKGIRVRGVMAMLPRTDDQQLLQNLCLKMREIFDILKKQLKNFDYLSLGMSADYKIAVQNGSNMIRLGSTIFGQRIYGGNN